ncbi:MAG: 2OG-Fe(II) oxygenase [Proteobacteria bacterium]|nr:MAG: 2OG-Fe(II) oxygenase [Pseudomonadota bacterium]
MKLEELGAGTFIYRCRGALAPDFCDDVVSRFEASPTEQYEGRVGQQQERHAPIKKTMDLRISGKAQWKDVDGALFASLREALSSMAHTHPFFGSNSFKDIGYNLQRYREGEYYHWHVDSGPGSFSQRQLVAIWYLNDVDGPGGETEFAFQNLTVRPKRGDLLLFPPFWTHVHRAVTLQGGVKYIATTWVCFA